MDTAWVLAFWYINFIDTENVVGTTSLGRERQDVPVECASEDNVFVRAELLQPLREIALVDQTTSLIDNKKRKDNPMPLVSIALLRHPMLSKRGGGAYIAAA